MHAHQGKHTLAANSFAHPPPCGFVIVSASSGASTETSASPVLPVRLPIELGPLPYSAIQGAHFAAQLGEPAASAACTANTTGRPSVSASTGALMGPHPNGQQKDEKRSRSKMYCILVWVVGSINDEW